MNGKTNEQFAADLKKFAAKVDMAPAILARVLAVKIFSGVVKRTPVDTGAARASWNVAANRNPGGGVVGVQGGQLSASAASSLAQSGLRSLAKLGPYDRIVIFNNVPYIQRLEYGGYGDGPKTAGGFSRQAPAGMVRVTMAEVGSVMRKV